MEKDSFEKQEVADILNEHFIAIKVDREERPDVDKLYMDSVVALSGRGGWPMSVFLTPELVPFYGGTFFWKEQFIKLLAAINNAWKNEKEQIYTTASQVRSYLERIEPKAANIAKQEILLEALDDFSKRFDPTHGGFGQAPKFPPASSLSLLLRIHHRSSNQDALEIVTKTLDAMARGGMYDHLGGGFHRYSTDRYWLVPHFEKMLYDNALLAVTYLEAFQATKNQMYLNVAEETLNYVLREMTDKNGGFYSAQDAGEVDKEGEFYVWQETELKDLLSEDEFEQIKEIYGVTLEGNFENHTILNLQDKFDWSIKKDIQEAQKKLFAARSKREAPHKDDKILTAWSALMITAMAKAYQVTQDKKYLEAAQDTAKFIKNNLFQNNKLLRRYRDGEAKHAAVLDDYAYFIQALIELYQTDFDESWITFAEQLQEIQNQLFWDNQNGGYFFNDESLLVRKKDFADGAKPSANAISALNLLKLYQLSFKKEYLEKAEAIFQAASSLNQHPSGFSSLLTALDFYLDNSKEVVVIGDLNSETARSLREHLSQRFLPNIITAFGSSAELEDTSRLTVFRGKVPLENQTTIYVCENNTCKKPTNSLSEAVSLIEDYAPLR